MSRGYGLVNSEPSAALLTSRQCSNNVIQMRTFLEEKNRRRRRLWYHCEPANWSTINFGVKMSYLKAFTAMPEEFNRYCIRGHGHLGRRTRTVQSDLVYLEDTRAGQPERNTCIQSKSGVFVGIYLHGIESPLTPGTSVVSQTESVRLYMP